MKLHEIIAEFKKPIPKSMIKSYRHNNNSPEIKYVSWYDYCDLLDNRAGFGCWEWNISVSHTSTILITVGTLTIHAEDKCISMSATGEEQLAVTSYGTASSNAEAMAFRRCCAKLGLGRHLWEKPQFTSAPTKAEYPRKNGDPMHLPAPIEIDRETWLSLRR